MQKQMRWSGQLDMNEVPIARIIVLHQEPPYQGRGSDAEHTQASGAEVPDSHYRAFQAARIEEALVEMYLGEYRCVEWQIPRRRCGSAAWFISIGTCSVACLGGRWRQ